MIFKSLLDEVSRGQNLQCTKYRTLVVYMTLSLARTLAGRDSGQSPTRNQVLHQKLVSVGPYWCIRTDIPYHPWLSCLGLFMQLRHKTHTQSHHRVIAIFRCNGRVFNLSCRRIGSVDSCLVLQFPNGSIVRDIVQTIASEVTSYAFFSQLL